MSRNVLNKLALIGAIAAMLIAVVGCSDSNPLINNTNNNSAEGPSLALENKTTFSVKGIVEKFDVDQRVIQFTGGEFSTRPQTVLVAREANLALQPGGTVIPFDFKYIEIGQALSVTGQHNGSSRVGDLFTLYRGTGDIDANEPSLATGEQDVEQRRYAGTIAKLDLNARVIEFAGNDFGNVNQIFHIDREAMLRTLPSRSAVAFDFKYVNTGDFVVLYGAQRAEGGADINLVELNSQIDVDDATNQPSFSSTGSDDVAAGFRLSGAVDKYDIDQRFIQFEGSDFGTQAYTFEVDRNATMRLLPDQTEIPFNFKFIEVGTELTVLGNVRADGERIASLVEVRFGTGEISTDNNTF